MSDVKDIRKNIAEKSEELKGSFETLEGQEGASTPEQRMQSLKEMKNLHL